jgi:hypothetical protein
VPSEHAGQVLGQAIVRGPDGVHSGPKGNPFLVDFQEPVHPRRRLDPVVIDVG